MLKESIRGVQILTLRRGTAEQILKSVDPGNAGLWRLSLSVPYCSVFAVLRVVLGLSQLSAVEESAIERNMLTSKMSNEWVLQGCDISMMSRHRFYRCDVRYPEDDARGPDDRSAGGKGSTRKAGGGSFISHPVSIGAMVFLVILVGAFIVGLIILFIIRKRRQKRRIKGLKSYNENVNKVMYADTEGRARLLENIEASVETENSSEVKKE